MAAIFPQYTGYVLEIGLCDGFDHLFASVVFPLDFSFLMVFFRELCLRIFAMSLCF